MSQEVGSVSYQHLRGTTLHPHLDLQGLQGRIQVLHSRGQSLRLRLGHFTNVVL